jgi:hypothetical protein
MDATLRMLFPNVHDTITHTEYTPSPTDLPDVVLAIPKGTPAHVWITTVNGSPTAVAKHVVGGTIQSWPIANTSYTTFRPDTLFRATLLTKDASTTVACIEDLLCFKNQNCTAKVFGEKLEIMLAMFDETTPTPSHLHFALPLMATSLDQLTADVQSTTSYPIECIRVRYFGKFRARCALTISHWTPSTTTQPPMPPQPPPPPGKTRIFNVTATATHDGYTLSDGTVTDTLLVSDLRISLMMSNLFGNHHPSHARLDAMEESDDENEAVEGKDTSTIRRVLCQRHPTLPRWIPIKAAD